MSLLGPWHFDPAVLAGVAVTIGLYAWAMRLRTRRLRDRTWAAAGTVRRLQATPSWPRTRTAALLGALAVALIALESPLDAAADLAFTPHMLQHLLLTDVVAPLLLLAGPLPLALAALPAGRARAVVAVLRGPVVRVLTHPAFAWTLFVTTLYVLHLGPLFERSLDDPFVHVGEHLAFLATSLLFWLPVVATPPTPWTDGPLAYPLRMLYVLLAMPAEAFLGFSIFGSPRILYPHYAAAGLADQQAAGELMWIGSGFAMFVAFMLVGIEWGASERKLGEQQNRRLDREAREIPASAGTASG